MSSICAASSLTALSAVGLALARPNEGDDDDADGDGDSAASAGRTRHPADMAAVAHYPLPRDSAVFSFSATQQHQPRRLASEGDEGRQLQELTVDHKRRSTASKGGTIGRESEGGRRSGTPSSWMRRLSSNMSSTMSTSRESSRAPTSRPASAAFSYSNSNGSAAVSHSGSTTPIFTPPSLPPNKLVKRTSSAHSTRGSPFDSGSRLPVLRRPATSHQRSATLQESSLSSSQGTGDSPWRHYFTPRVAAADAISRRGSTGIPNPIKRVYPSRRHIPTLVSARELLARPAVVELDRIECEEDFPMAPSTASSPFPSYAPHFEESTAPRRSFSISDLLANSSQPMRVRPSSGKGRPWSSRSLRTERRVFSEPQPSMGTQHSRVAGHESERPSKRRSIAAPSLLQRSKSSSSNNHAAQNNASKAIDLRLVTESQPLHVVAHNLVDEPPSRAQTPPPHGQSQLPHPSLSTSAARPARLSVSISEMASTSAGSDSDARSIGDNSTDYQSDNVYDSYPTRTTRSSSGRRGPHIETIFDESPPSFSSGRSTKLRDFLSDGNFPGGDLSDRYRHSTIEEEDSVVSTPVRSLRNKSVTSTPSARPGAPHVFSSSPPTMNVMPDPDELDWDAPEVGSDRGLGIQPHLPYTANGASAELNLPFRFGSNLQPAYPHSANTTPQRSGVFSMDKANLFDWAEQQPSPSHATNSPPRPRTVHGKKDQDSRWSRPSGRRGPSAMHARSHSVPVVPDLEGKRDTVAANKFGTWGVGSKAVTEDWNEDFDFGEPPPLPTTNTYLDEKRIDSGHEMFVPKSIREQQENVVANIGLLREWGLLIEELKELRVRAVGLEMMTGPYQQAWREVDAMIELADQESEEHTLEPRGTPPSSPGFDYGAFEEHTPPRQSPTRPFEYASPLPDHAPTPKQPSTPQNTLLATRPRKDSELVAQSVIAALQRRDTADSAAVQPVGASKKVPFDTATLRHIVPYVNGLKRRVKDAVRETEGLYSSPHRRPSPVLPTHSRQSQADAPAFRNIFNEPQDDITTRRQTRREQAVTDNDGFVSFRLEQSGSANRTTKRS